MCARTFFSSGNSVLLALWPTASGKLSGSDRLAGLFWPEPVLRSRAFYLITYWSNRPDRTNKKRPKIIDLMDTFFNNIISWQYFAYGNIIVIRLLQP